MPPSRILAISLLLPFLVSGIHAQALSGLNILANGSPDQYHMHHVPLGRTLMADFAKDLGFKHSYHTDLRWVHPDTLAKYQVLVWAVGRPDSIPAANRAHVEAWLAKGGSMVLIHTALQRFGDWTGWDLILGGTRMNGHPAPQTARNVREDATHAITQGLPAEFRLNDENYNLTPNPRGKNGVRVLLNIDEKSYSPGPNAMGDHPSTWIHEGRGGRVFVTLLGHNQGTWTTDQTFRTLLKQGLTWAAEPHLKPNALAFQRASRSWTGLLQGRRLSLPGVETPVHIRLLDMQGRLVYENNLPSGGSLDLEGLPAGLYRLAARGGGVHLHRSLILP